MPPGERSAGSAQGWLQPRALSSQPLPRPQLTSRSTWAGSGLQPKAPAWIQGKKGMQLREWCRRCTLSICNISDQKRGLISSVYKASERRKCPIKALHKLVLKLPALLVNLGSSLCSGLDHGLSIRPTGPPGQAVKCTPCQCLPASWDEMSRPTLWGAWVENWGTGSSLGPWTGPVPVRAWLPVAQVSETFLPSPISLSLSCSPSTSGPAVGGAFSLHHRL